MTPEEALTDLSVYLFSKTFEYSVKRDRTLHTAKFRITYLNQFILVNKITGESVTLDTVEEVYDKLTGESNIVEDETFYEILVKSIQDAGFDTDEMIIDNDDNYHFVSADDYDKRLELFEFLSKEWAAEPNGHISQRAMFIRNWYKPSPEDN